MHDILKRSTSPCATTVGTQLLGFQIGDKNGSHDNTQVVVIAHASVTVLMSSF